MKKIIFFLLVFAVGSAQNKKNNELQIFDISQIQIRLMSQYKNTDTILRAKVFKDSIYKPFSGFWDGYVGGAENMVSFLNGAMPRLPEMIRRNEAIDGKKIVSQLNDVNREMKKLTGYEAKGKWFIAFGPGYTDLGGLGDYAMLIDLSHESNSSNERILKMFPHELTHQIMSNVNKAPDDSAINSIVGEGFAVYMNQMYWGKKYTVAENLGYTESELQICDKNEAVLKNFLKQNAFSNDENMIDVFRSRNTKLNDNLPGAIGYYLGYKIVESYVQKFGASSWKDVFVKSAKEIYLLSGY